MTIEQLYQFTEVCRYRSITLAANQLHVSRQSLSITVKKLEKEFSTELFVRLPNGVALTKAGEALYYHAQKVINDTNALKQEMVQFSPLKSPLKFCRIGIAKPLMTYYGNTLYEKLSETFPNTYFHFSIFVVEVEDNQDSRYPSDEFDISILLISEISLTQFATIPSGYTTAWLRPYPIYVWLSALSPWNEYTSLDLKMLKDVPVCLLKDSFGKTNLFSYLYHNINEVVQDITIVELEQNLCALIDSWGYYTVDIPLYDNHLAYEPLFKDKNIVAKPTNYHTTSCIVYQEDSCSDFYPIIADVLSSPIALN